MSTPSISTAASVPHAIASRSTSSADGGPSVKTVTVPSPTAAASSTPCETARRQYAFISRSTPARSRRPSAPSWSSSNAGICFTSTAMRMSPGGYRRSAASRPVASASSTPGGVLMNLRATPARPSSSTPCARRSASARARSPAGTRPTCWATRCGRSSSATTSIPGGVDDVVGGCVTQVGEQGCNVTRNAWVAAGLPWHVPATSVDRQCGSSQQAMHFVAQGVIAGAYDLAIACGVESMTRAPMSSNARGGVGPFSPAFLEACNGRARDPVRGGADPRRQVRRHPRGDGRVRASRATGAPPTAPTAGTSPPRSCRCRVKDEDGADTGERARADEGIRRDTTLEAWPPCRRRGSRTTSPRPTSPPATRRR